MLRLLDKAGRFVLGGCHGQEVYDDVGPRRSLVRTSCEENQPWDPGRDERGRMKKNRPRRGPSPPTPLLQPHNSIRGGYGTFSAAHTSSSTYPYPPYSREGREDNNINHYPGNIDPARRLRRTTTDRSRHGLRGKYRGVGDHSPGSAEKRQQQFQYPEPVLDWGRIIRGPAADRQQSSRQHLPNIRVRHDCGRCEFCDDGEVKLGHHRPRSPSVLSAEGEEDVRIELPSVETDFDWIDWEEDIAAWPLPEW